MCCHGKQRLDPSFFPWIQGCTDSSSCQYNPLANIDDGSCGYNNSATVVITACDSLVWNSVNYTSSGLYNQTLTNVSGCDSVVTLDLGIISIDTSLSYSISPSVLTSLVPNASYQWLDCNNNNTPINGETNQSYYPTSNGSYAVEIFQNGCSAVSSCYTVNNLMSLSFNILDSIYCNGDLAEVEVNASNGNSPYSFLWSNGALGSNIYLSAGSYTCTVTDTFGFNFTDSITITEPSIITYNYSVNNSNIDFDINGGTPYIF